MTLLQARTTKVALCVVVFLAASGSATVITMTNPSFETLPSGGLPSGGCGMGCSFSEGIAIPGWTNSAFLSGQFQPGTQVGNLAYFNSLPDGITIAYSDDGTISQTVSTTVQNGITYVLTVDLGQRNDLPFTASADLLVGSTMVVAATGNPPSPGGWSTYTATFTGTAATAGETITIQLNSTGFQGDFDNVRLAASTVPEPSSMLLLGSGVLVLVQGLRRKLL